MKKLIIFNLQKKLKNTKQKVVNLEKNSNFVELNNISRIWAIGSIHSNLNAFNSIKDFIIKNFKQNDKLIFLGNVIGLGDKSKETLSSIINLKIQFNVKI